MRPAPTFGADQGQLDSVLDAVLDGVILTTPDGVRANPAARRILGASGDDDLRTALLDPRTLDGEPIELDPAKLIGQTALESGGSGRFRLRITSLDRRELVVDGSVSQAGGGVAVVFRDVTDEHAESELNRHTLQAIFDSLPEGLGLTDRDTHELLAVNRAFCELVGMAEREIVGLRPPFPWWDEREDPNAGFVPGTRIERRYRRPDGRTRPVEVSHFEIGASGDTAPLLALIRDITNERRLQQQLVQSGKLTAVGELAAGVAHEINNPLFAILGLTEFLLKESEPGSKARQRLELIQQTGLEIKEIVRALLEFARENAEDHRVGPLEEIIQSTIDLVRRTNAHKGVEIVDRYDGSGVLVEASSNQLKQVMLNLIANARQAMPAGGTVTIDVQRDGDWAVVTVADDGPGIPPELLGRVFEPFFTTKRTTGGTGLGLSVSLGIAESHGGTLTVASEVGVGSAFTLRLPRVAVGDV